MLTAERFETRSRIDVRHRHDALGVNNLAQIIPGVFDLLDPGHVRHRASRGHVGQNNAHSLALPLRKFFGTIRQDVRRLGHEMDAAKDNEAAIAVAGCQLAKFQTVTAQIAMSNDFILLIVVPQDEKLRTKFLADHVDALRQLLILERFVGSELVHGSRFSQSTHEEPARGEYWLTGLA